MPAEFELSDDQATDAIRGLVKDTVNQGDIGIEKLTQWIWAMEQQIVNLVDTLQSSIEARKRAEGDAQCNGAPEIEHRGPSKGELRIRPIFGDGLAEVVHDIPGGKAFE